MPQTISGFLVCFIFCNLFSLVSIAIISIEKKEHLFF